MEISQKQNESEHKKKIGIVIVVAAVIMIGMALFFLWPQSKGYVGNCLQGTMQTMVNEEVIIPQNVTCTYGSGETVDLQVVSTGEGLEVETRAFPYDGYTFEYDIETAEGVRHLKFMVMKTHNGGPRINFRYRINLYEQDGIWYAEVWLLEKDTIGKSQVISLEEDDTAYVQLGP